jgi:sigma-54 dependent transcriptional regulator, acetoin dehydrogenase operon transcriptional activator AcoR
MALPPTVPAHQRPGRLAERERPIAASLGLPEQHLGVIDQSHQRCQAWGLSRIEKPEYAPLGRSDLSVVRERNQRLHSHAAPVMEMLFDQITGTQSMVLLCDAAGTVIHSIGDDDFLSRASKVALQPGVNWAEQSKGTNAIGTALIEERPTLVHADEHYMHANHFLTCSAAPILDPRGNILGVLDVTGDHRSYHQHTMGLVRMSARMIENHWLSDDYRDAMRLHFHSRPEFIGTLMEGILAVSPEGRITGANRGALEQLGLSGAALRMQSLVSLFGTTVAALVDRFRVPLATPMAVRTDQGQPLYLQARFNWPVWRDLGGDSSEPGLAGEGGGGGGPGPGLEESQAADASLSGVAPAAQRKGAAAVGSQAKTQPAAAQPSGLAHLNSGDPHMAAVVDKLRRVLDRDIPVLVLGETGTGKELLARAIHQDSQRSRQPFVAVNCASIPDTLIEAELFGYEEGAFTGARRKGAVGKILQAEGGTLFLDEIGDMPLPLQAHLLRVLQERQVTPLGSARSVPVNVSIICATHRNLREMIDAKAFREDLYYRLNGLAVRLPPLRERSDLQVLVRRILDETGLGSGLRVSPQAMAHFQNYNWPGNVRQLYNVLRTAAVMAGREQLITTEHLPDDFVEDLRRCPSLGRSLSMAARPSAVLPEPDAAADPAGLVLGALAPSASPPLPLGASLQDLELLAIKAAVEAAAGNISEAAKQLGVSRNTIYRKLRWKEAPSS